ncbi:hypothetical protein GCM10009621_20280 [Corynebacterium felinum]
MNDLDFPTILAHQDHKSDMKTPTAKQCGSCHKLVIQVQGAVTLGISSWWWVKSSPTQPICVRFNRK